MRAKGGHPVPGKYLPTLVTGTKPSARTALPQHGHDLAWINIAKGIGIILVVLGHTAESKWVTRGIYIFHMPLFFFLSGFLFAPKKVWAFLSQRAARTLVPYVSFAVLVMACDGLVGTMDHLSPTLPINDPLRALMKLLYGGRVLGGAYSVFWFITCLFLTQILFNFIISGLRLKRNRDWLGVMAVSSAVGYALSYVHRASPWDVFVVPIALVFYSAGHLYRRGLAKMRHLYPSAAVIAIGGLFCVAPMDMKNACYGTPVLTVAVALSWCITICKLSQLLERSFWTGAALQSIGGSSLTIMFLHQVVQIHTAHLGPRWLAILGALLMPWCIEQLMRKNAVAAHFFLGGRA